ncbi:hypothetical protein WN51_00716 [Melipona quadrifasciata]|uniref:Uncharacterized protein n=1 Tax=Melipona quadrifasciata TaxID=166423 RepID=A0A0M8ZYN9_9HYME|nr:hypothetical protein WN51_00716 [Melipona quadrifasciata]
MTQRNEEVERAAELNEKQKISENKSRNSLKAMFTIVPQVTHNLLKIVNKGCAFARTYSMENRKQRMLEGCLENASEILETAQTFSSVEQFDLLKCQSIRTAKHNLKKDKDERGEGILPRSFKNHRASSGALVFQPSVRQSEARVMWSEEEPRRSKEGVCSSR